MPNQDEIIKIILDVQNAEKVEQARKIIEHNEQAIRNLTEAYRTGGIGLTAYTFLTRQAAESIRAQQSALRDAGGAFNGRALMEFSRAAEDAQYGLAGVMNNIPGLVAALGGGSGLVGAISLAAVGAYQLYKHWDDLAGLFGNGKTLSEAAAMEELGKQTHKTAEEAEKLARYSAVDRKTKEIQEGKTKDQRETESAVTEAIVETGVRDLAVEMIKYDGTAFDAALPGITDPKAKGEDRKVLQNDKGENRTALVDARDAGEALDKYLALYKNGERTIARSDRAGGSYVERIDPARVQELQTNKAEAEKKLSDARLLAATQSLATNAVPQFYAGNLDATIKRLETDEAYMSGLDPTKRQDFVNRLKDATPEGRKAKERIDFESDRAWDDLQESIRSVKEWSADFKKRVQEATKSRSFLSKAEGALTGPERAAKKLHDDLEEQVAKSLKSRDFLDKAGKIRNNEDLTPAQQEAARRDAPRRKRLEEDQNALASDMMTAWRKRWDEQHRKPEVFDSISSFRDAIQTSGKLSDANPTAVEQLAVQRRIEENTKKMAEARNQGPGPARAG